MTRPERVAGIICLPTPGRRSGRSSCRVRRAGSRRAKRQQAVERAGEHVEAGALALVDGPGTAADGDGEARRRHRRPQQIAGTGLGFAPLDARCPLPSTNADSQAASGAAPARPITAPSPTTAAQSASSARSRPAHRISTASAGSASATAAPTSDIAIAGSRRSASTTRRSSTATPSTARTSRTSSSSEVPDGTRITSSSTTWPPPRSRMSIASRSPCTDPMRLATWPSAPGRSGSQRRSTSVRA